MTSVKRASSQKSRIYVPNVEGGDDTEIVTHITVPSEGGWAWVVVAASFLCIFINDAMLISFGSIFTDVRDNLRVPEASVALINSVAMAMTYFVGPLASGVINNYGFRECGMVGSIISCVSLLTAYFGKSYGTVLLFYGFFTGVGASFINLSSYLVVGFHFHRQRALAMSIAFTGSSAGCMVMYMVNSAIVETAGWRIVVLIQSSMAGLIFYLSMAYTPIKPLLVTQTTDEPTTVLTSLPNLADKQKSVTVQRMFNAVSNVNFPTAADVIQTGVVTDVVPSPSKISKTPMYTISTTSGALNSRQLRAIQSVINPSRQPSVLIPIITVAIDTAKKKGFWAKLCTWQKNASEARPMYKDDVFYHGRVQDLDVYKKSVVNLQDKDRFAIEYEMAVTRATTVDDLEEQKAKLCSIAMRRVFATMIDPKLLKCLSFSILGISAFFANLGVSVPYTFLQHRSEQQGLPASHCSSIISFIGLMNLIGRLVIGAIACKISPSKIYLTAAIVSGVGTIAFNFSFKTYYQYICAAIFGIFCSSLASMRCLVLINLFGLENLTNATGLIYIFQGVGSLISTPFSMFIKSRYGYSLSFYTAGIFLVLSGALTIPIQKVRNRELAAEAR